MTTIAEARAMVMREVFKKDSVCIACKQAVGRVLAEDILADLDSPPHRKSLVDGYAVQAADTVGGKARLQVVEEVYAGQVPSRAIQSGQATRIMTGAPLPEGADAVAMVEDTKIDSAEGDPQQHESVVVSTIVSPNEHVQERGSIMRARDVVLRQGHRIRPIEIGLLSEVGRTEVSVSELPVVSILPTGDELVDVSTVPGPGQIRNTNGPMLAALVDACGAKSIPHGVGHDDRESLTSAIESALQSSDILVLSGGVSMGRKDLVPEVLRSLDVQTVFHRVQLRPGKPLWFGVWNQAGRKTLVFGLPGNPVSSFVCFQLFVDLAIHALQGARACPRHTTVLLASDCTVQGNRPTYFPARHHGEDDNTVELLSWKGSADQRTMCDADFLAFFPSPGEYHAGCRIEALPLP